MKAESNLLEVRAPLRPAGETPVAVIPATPATGVLMPRVSAVAVGPGPGPRPGLAPPSPPRRIARVATAHEMAAQQRDISVAEFFQKNRHLLGFDSPRKALLTAVKEAVDNSLDACEEGGILPDVEVRIEVAPNGAPPPSAAQAERFVVTVSDNGPGIVKKQMGKVFARLLYGSKFHRLRMSRGQQGIGISAAGMYGQLTTGKPTKVVSKIKGEPEAHVIEVSIDTKRNLPVEHETRRMVWDREHGTSVTIELAGRYQKGRASVDEYLELTSIANPHAQIAYHTPDGEKKVYARGVDYLPVPPREIKPHPYGIELGMLLKMLQDTKSHWLSGFLSSDFCRVSPRLADEICKAAKLSPRARPRDIVGPQAEALYKALQSAKLISPPTDCLSPIGEPAILAGLVKTLKADFYTATTRPPKVYRGNPFVIEAGLAFGKGDGRTAKDPAALAAEQLEKQANGELEARAEGEQEDDDVELARVIRFANRVPLIYQQSACATFRATLRTAWRSYGLSQSRGALPQGPLVVFIHMASVWVPFTSEAKEAIAEYDEIVDEAKRALQECGRRLGLWLRKRERAKAQFERRHTFQRYIEEVAEACKRIKGGKLNAERLKKQLSRIAEKITGGEETDKLVGKKGQPEAEEPLEHTVVLTPEGLEGSLPAAPGAAAETQAVAEAAPVAVPAPTAAVGAEKPAAATGPGKNGQTGELIRGATARRRGKAHAALKAARTAGPAQRKKRARQRGLFDD